MSVVQNDRQFSIKMAVISRFLSNGHFGSKIWKNITKLNVMLNQNYRSTTKMAVITSNDRYWCPKWTLWAKAPLYLQRKLTVQKIILWSQNDRYIGDIWNWTHSGLNLRTVFLVWASLFHLYFTLLTLLLSSNIQNFQLWV